MTVFEFFIDFADALLLKQLGFDWDIPTCYKVNEKDAEVYMCHIPFNWNMPRDLYEKYGSDNLFHAFIHEDDEQIECISAPNLDVVQRWLREVHKLHITIFSSSQESWMFRITKPHQQLEDGIYGEDFESFEDAQDAAIKKCLEILK